MAPLHLAANNGKTELVKYFCNQPGCIPDMKDLHSRTPLHYACQGGYVEVVKYLVESHNCNPLSEDINEVSPVLIASMMGNEDIVEFFKQVNPEVSVGLKEKVSQEAGDNPWIKQVLSQNPKNFISRMYAVQGDLAKLKQTIETSGLEVATAKGPQGPNTPLSLIHISEPTRPY